MHYPKLKIISRSYGTCTLYFKYTCSLSSLVFAANEPSWVLNDIVISDDEDDNRNNEGEESDDTLIIFCKQWEDASSFFSSPEDKEDKKDEDASIAVQESSSESDDPSSDSDSDFESKNAKGLHLKHEELVLEMSENRQMWKIQREYVREKRSESVNNFVTKILGPIRCDGIVANYMQNFDFPHCGQE